MLLVTKLFVPRPPSRAVCRARLFDLLDETDEAALTLVSAPAGFGKTALLGAWLRDRPDLAPAWVSLDEGDDDPPRFWSYLVAALQTVGDGVAASAARLLLSPQLPSGEAIATVILNDLARAPKRVVLVLDDYHVISSPSIQSGLVFLVEHMPPNARLVVTTRADPPWPLARLRAGKRMVELRADDLRFTEGEAALFLDAAGLALAADDVRTLEERTEGWVAGLRMAALSMQHRADVGEFIRDFAGSHRFVLDYLGQEVFDQQSEATRAFLIQTSILERLNGELCDAVRGSGGSQEILELLEHSNLFTESLDDERRWYRYHQLFADVLRSRLDELEPAFRAELHRRASEWLEAHGFPEQAVHHAFEAGDAERAARLMARIASATFMVRNQLLVLEWLRRLPDEAIATAPVLALVRAWSLFVTGDWEGMMPALAVAAESIGSAAHSSERDALQAQLDGISSWVAYQTGDLEGCVTLAGVALERMPDDGVVPRRIVSSARGYGLLLLGEIEPAERIAAATIAESRRAGDALTESLAIGLVAQAHLLRGELERAGRAYEESIATATVGGEQLPSAAIAQVQLAEVLRERDELAEAEQTLRASIKACEDALGLPEWVFEGNVTLARVLAARGDLEGSRQAAERAERAFEQELAPGGMEPIVGRALAYRARYWLATGDVARAYRWLREQGVSPDGGIDAPRQTLGILLVRTLLAEGEWVEALRVVERLSSLGGSRPVGIAVELSLVNARTLQATGRDEEAATLLVGALRNAEREGYVRLFVDEGVPMRRLLELAATLEPATALYVEHLLSSLDAGGRPPDAGGRRDEGDLLEPLNERELQILRMLAVGRSNAEIAADLYLSVNTVKWHARRIYAKLGVNRRSLAVARAREAGIL